MIPGTRLNRGFKVPWALKSVEGNQRKKTRVFFFLTPTKEFLLQTQRDALRLIILPLSHTFATKISAAEWLRFPQAVYSLFVRFATTSLHISPELVTLPSLVDRNKIRREAKESLYRVGVFRVKIPSPSGRGPFLPQLSAVSLSLLIKVLSYSLRF